MYVIFLHAVSLIGGSILVIVTMLCDIERKQEWRIKEFLKQLNKLSICINQRSKKIYDQWCYFVIVVAGEEFGSIGCTG